MTMESYDEWQIDETPPVDNRGRPTTYLCYRILKTMFKERNRWLTPKKLSVLLAAKYSNTDIICQQLKEVDFLSENPSQPGQYRYNLASRNVDMQTVFEKFLVDVELRRLPVHLMLDYSPSCPWPGDYL